MKASTKQLAVGMALAVAAIVAWAVLTRPKPKTKAAAPFMGPPSPDTDTSRWGAPVGFY